jgi:hypothetical protein
MWAGHQLAHAERYTEGDARTYLNAGLLGAQVGGSILSLTESPSESPRFVAGTLTASALGGLAAGTVLLRDRDFSKSEGNLIALGTYAGGLMGSALAAVGESEEDGAFVLSTLGSVLGFGISVGIFAEDAERRATTAASALDLRITPSLQAPRTPAAGPSSWTRSVRPGLTLRASF